MHVESMAIREKREREQQDALRRQQALERDLVFRAAERGNVEEVKRFLGDRTPPDQLRRDGSNLLHAAANSAEKGLAVAEYLISAGVPVDVKDSTGHTPAYYAALTGNLPLLKLLIEKGGTSEDLGKAVAPADIVLSGNKADTVPLINRVARGAGGAELAQFLLDRGAEKAGLEVGDKDGVTPLHLAARYGKVDLAEFLLKNEVAVDPADHEGSTPLHYAAKTGQIQVARLLLDRGADRTAKNKAGQAPLDLTFRGAKLLDMLK